MMTQRKFFVFNSETEVRRHISQVKTLNALFQLQYDIQAADCNLTRFKNGIDGVYAVDCYAGDKSFRHVFLTQLAFDRFGEPSQDEADSYTVLEDAVQ